MQIGMILLVTKHFHLLGTEKAGEPLDTPILEEDGFKSVAIFKDTTITGAWNTLRYIWLPDNVSSDDLSKLFT